MKFIMYSVSVTALAYACVGLSTLLGQSADAALFGAIISVGIFAASTKGDA